MKKITSVFLCLIIIAGMAINAFAAVNLDDTAKYLINTVDSPNVASVGGEWTIIGLCASGLEIDSSYYDKYYANLLGYVKAKDGVLHSRKYTEYSRVVLALTAMGRDPRNVGGYNLLAPLYDYDKVIWQGINGPIWALIALDSGNYEAREIRDKYIARILESEKQNGGWALSESEESADADVTAMALIALSKYQSRPEVNPAIERAIKVLSLMQNENGGYSSYNTEASESTAQVLTALAALKISCDDPRFVKNGKTLIENICSFKKEDGSFSHSEKADLMATEQCFYALVAAKRLQENKPSLFDMENVKKSADLQIGLAGKNGDVNASEIKFENRTFFDIYGHKNQKAIEELAKRGIINGMSEDVFAPDNTMTRAEFAAIIVRALGLPKKSGTYFKDINSSDWHFDYINTAYGYGIVNGVSETDFNPNAAITKQEAMVMICRAAKLCGMENNFGDVAVRNILAEFTDYMTVSSWAKPSVAFCFERGISDRSEVEIKPFEAVKRCEIADMIYNLLRGAILI